jgi:hypothetical protein
MKERELLTISGTRTGSQFADFLVVTACLALSTYQLRPA